MDTQKDNELSSQRGGGVTKTSTETKELAHVVQLQSGWC